MWEGGGTIVNGGSMEYSWRLIQCRDRVMFV